MPKPRDVVYAKHLPEVGSVVKIGIPELGYPVETMITGRMPYNFESAAAGKLPDEAVEVKEAIFTLALAPAEFSAVLIHTITGWRMFHKDSHKPTIVEVALFPRLRH
jgi:hypothetical protein